MPDKIKESALRADPNTGETYVPDDMQILFTDGISVVYDRGAYIVSFLQVDYPILRSQKQADQVSEVRKKCVARLAFTPERMALVVEVLQRSTERERPTPKKGLADLAAELGER